MNEKTHLHLMAYQLLARIDHMKMTAGPLSDETFIGDLKAYYNVEKQESDYELGEGNIIKW